jgi:hypothetical protein
VHAHTAPRREGESVKRLCVCVQLLLGQRRWDDALKLIGTWKEREQGIW